MKAQDQLPSIDFRLRTADAELGAISRSVSTEDCFGGKISVLIGVPGAFTPTCSKSQVPSYKQAYNDLLAAGAEEVYCVSVNDEWVMHAWANDLNCKNIVFLADGGAEFTIAVDELCDRTSVNQGLRSKRYAAIIDDMRVVDVIHENHFDDYVYCTPEAIIDLLNKYTRVKRHK